MKKTALFFVVLAFIVFNCKKKVDTPPNTSDATPPVITLAGKQKDTVFLQSTYADPGATALDNKDGDLTPYIVVSGSVNTNMTGIYIKEYNVRDAAGNSAKSTREVLVKNAAAFITGNYSVACNCATVTPGQTTLYSNSIYSASAMHSTTVNNSFWLSEMNTGTEGAIAGPFNISLSGQSMSTVFFGTGTGYVNTNGSFMTGTLSPAKTSFTIETAVTPVNYPSRTMTCTNIYSRQ
jgi:hypothetical protein